MRFIVIAVLFLLTFPIKAEGFALQILAGAKKAAPHLGADLDWEMGEDHTLGAFLVYGGEKENITNEFWSVGAAFKIHFGPDQWKVYIGPGFGIAQFEETVGEKELTFGSIMKVGALYNFTSCFSFGLEHMIYINWFSDEARIGFSRSSATFRFSF